MKASETPATRHKRSHTTPARPVTAFPCGATSIVYTPTFGNTNNNVTYQVDFYEFRDRNATFKLGHAYPAAGGANPVPPLTSRAFSVEAADANNTTMYYPCMEVITTVGGAPVWFWHTLTQLPPANNAWPGTGAADGTGHPSHFWSVRGIPNTNPPPTYLEAILYDQKDDNCLIQLAAHSAGGGGGKGKG